jgi:benzylsuccinate CoA-transferase BbsF subunit
MGALPLAGLKVADFSWVLAGPTVGRTLADYGATVVKVESAGRPDLARFLSPFKDGKVDPDYSGQAGDINAGKLGLALDLAQPEARKVARKVVDWADIVLESFSPGTMQKWGLDYDTLRQSKPDLIMLSTCLMGNFGPLSKIAGFGSAGSCLSGIHHVTGWPDMVPTGYSGPYTDFVAPKLSLVALLAALDRRSRSGEGCYIDLSQVETGLHFMSLELLEYSSTGAVAARKGNADPVLYPNDVYPCLGSDGQERFVALSVRDQRDWTMLLEALALSGLQDLAEADMTERLAHKQRIDAAIAAAVAKLTPEDVEERLQKVGVPAYTVLIGPDLLHDPQIEERRHFLQVEHPRRGASFVESTRIHLSRTLAQPQSAAPDIGEHETLILQDILGLSSEEIGSLRHAGALR